MSSHSKAAAKFIADAPRTAWHDKALFAVRTKRDKMMHEVPEWEALREASSQIKRHTLSHLAHYLEEFERNATANGIVVHWAADADEMNRTVWELISAHGGKNLIKSKSMLSEECGLTPYLLQRGVDAVESDLGERIMQLLHEPPSHIVLPAIAVRVKRSAPSSKKCGIPNPATATRPTSRTRPGFTCAPNSSAPTSP